MDARKEVNPDEFWKGLSKEDEQNNGDSTPAMHRITP
jgi:hypothetical protein